MGRNFDDCLYPYSTYALNRAYLEEKQKRFESITSNIPVVDPEVFRRIDEELKHVDNGNIADLILYFQKQSLYLQDLLDAMESPLTKYTYEELKAMNKSSFTGDLLIIFNFVGTAKAYIYDFNETILSCKRILQRRERISPQSGEIGTMAEGVVTTNEQVQNFSDMGGEVPDASIAGFSNDMGSGAQELTMMGDYLSRPIEIANFSVAVGSSVSNVYSVWRDFTSTPAVRAKLRNFAYLRGDLNVRISVSGTPFHYGKILVAYRPYGTLSSPLILLKGGVAVTPGLRPLLINHLSQSHGSYILDVRDNAPLDIVCPFISTKPMHRLFNDSSAVIATDFTDMIDAGDLYIYTIDIVRACTSSPSSVNIQVYAWMDNVQLGTNTATQMAIPTESGELKVGPVERIASRVYQVSSSLQGVSWLSPFATAVSLASGAISQIASIFGWSRPIINDNATRVRNIPFTNTAVTIGNSVARKITIDPEQQLTLDASCVATLEDELIITSISRKNSYLTTFDWATTDPVMSTNIYNCRVHPNLNTVYAISSVNYVQPTAMAFAVAPFKYWRGDIVFRLEIVTSAFHRGKLAIFWEPNNSQYTLINAALSLNKQYMQVIDIQETQTVDFVVRWGAYRKWLRNADATNAVLNTTLTSPTTQGLNYCNGYIGVVPFTKLQSPDNSSVFVNVYVRCDNLQVNCLDATMLNRDRLIPPQSGTCNILNDVSTMDLNKSSATTETISSDHFGEQVLSFRPALKRYTTAYTATVTSITSLNCWVIQHSIMPRISPAYGDSANPYTTLFSYLRYAYLGYKGSIRWILSANVPYGVVPMMVQKTSLLSPSTTNVTSTTVTTTGTTPDPSYITGTVIDNPNTNGGIEVEFPFYTNNLFCFSFNYTNDDVLGQESMDREWFRNWQTRFSGLAGGSPNAIVHGEVASGEDFSFLRFSGAPFYTAPVIA